MSDNSITKQFANFVAFVAMSLVGVALLLGFVIDKPNISAVLYNVAEIMAYAIIIFYALIYAWTRGKKSNVQVIYMIWWAIATALIVIFVILAKIK